MKKLFVSLMLSVSMLGCANLLPQTTPEKLAAGYVTVTTVATTTSSMLLAGKISAEDAEHVLITSRVAKTGLDVSRKLTGGAATAKVDSVLVGLKALESYLNERK